MKYEGSMYGVPFTFTFDLQTKKGTFTMQEVTDTFDFVANQDGSITISNFTSTKLVIKSASLTADYVTLTVVASYMGGADATMTGTYTK